MLTLSVLRIARAAFLSGSRNTSNVMFSKLYFRNNNDDPNRSRRLNRTINERLHATLLGRLAALSYVQHEQQLLANAIYQT